MHAPANEPLHFFFLSAFSKNNRNGGLDISLLLLQSASDTSKGSVNRVEMQE